MIHDVFRSVFSSIVHSAQKFSRHVFMSAKRLINEYFRNFKMIASQIYR